MLLLCCATGICLRAQSGEWDLYQRLRAHGDMPADFRFSQQLSDSASPLADQAYYIQELIKSGNVLYGDTVTRYLERILRRLLPQPQTGLPPLRVYAVRSAAMNAFATGRGIIFVNLGLIAKMESEAQLAFVLSHEISHVLRQHDLAIFREMRKDIKAVNIFGAASLERSLLARNLYTREKEQEADLHGLELFLAAGYPAGEALAAFDALATASIPAGQRLLAPEFFRLDGAPFPSGYFLEKPQATLARRPPSQSVTHPDPEMRREAVARILSERTLPEPAAAAGADAFAYVRKRCRFECCEQYLMQHSYEVAISEAYDLLEGDPNSFYLRYTIAYALYALAQYAAAGKFWDVHEDFETLAGPAQQVSHFFEKMRADELVQLAFSHVSGLYGEFRDKRSLAAMQEDLFCSLCRQMDQPNCLCDETVKPVKASRNFTLGLDSAVFVNPYYHRSDFRYAGRGILHMSSARGQQQLDQWVDQYARKAGIHPVILSLDKLAAADDQGYNDWAMLMGYMHEQGSSLIHLVSIYHDEVHRLAHHFHSHAFVWLGYNAYVIRNQNRTYWMMCLPLFPISFAYSFLPRYSTQLYVAVYDLEKDHPLLIYPRVMRVRDTRDVIQGSLYDVLYQLHARPR